MVAERKKNRRNKADRRKEKRAMPTSAPKDRRSTAAGGRSEKLRLQAPARTTDERASITQRGRQSRLLQLLHGKGSGVLMSYKPA